MRYLLTALALSLVACADKAVTCDDRIGAPDEVQGHGEYAPFVLFPDNTTRKTYAYRCTDGSSQFVATDAPASLRSSETTICILRDNPENVLFSDGQTHKSDIYECWDGCLKAVAVGNVAIQKTFCQ